MAALEDSEIHDAQARRNRAVAKANGRQGPDGVSGRPTKCLGGERTDDAGVEPNWKLIFTC